MEVANSRFYNLDFWIFVEYKSHFLDCEKIVFTYTLAIFFLIVSSIFIYTHSRVINSNLCLRVLFYLWYRVDSVSLLLSSWWIVIMRANAIEAIFLIILMGSNFSISVGVPERLFAWRRRRRSFLVANARTDSSRSTSGYSIRRYLSGKSVKSHQWLQ